MDIGCTRWIVTLDVLKCEKKGICLMPCSLNSNIRCIEIFLSGHFKLNNVCWIVTLDVLK